MLDLDFTLAKYVELCRAVLESPYKIVTLAQFLSARQPQGPYLVFRHDVDRNLASAIRMAELEASLGIKSTYYVRSKRSVFRPAALAHMNDLGHEVGYHYETLAKANGDLERAIELFERELSQFCRVVPVKTISMHGSPLSRWDNRDLWKSYDLRAHDLLGEAYLSIDFGRIYYFTDTGRCWDAGSTNLRDRVASQRPARRTHTTDDLIGLLRAGLDLPTLINTHPNRWATGGWPWLLSLGQDWVVNTIKRGIAWQRARVPQKRASDAHSC